MFYLELGDISLAGASPEVMVRVEDGEVTVRPIAGTRPRGTSERDDAALARELLADPKELAEHVMLVDLGRNDVGRVARDRHRSRSPSAWSSSATRTSCTSSRTCAAGSAAAATASTRSARRFPPGTLSGAPKMRAMEIIEELEPVRRGVYGGAVGYFGFSGAMDTGIAIRTVLIKDGARLRAGRRRHRRRLRSRARAPRVREQGARHAPGGAHCAEEL